MEETLQSLKQAIIDGNRNNATELTNQLLEAGVSPKEILDDGLIAGMSTVGELFKKGEYFVPEMLIAARAMKSALELLRPQLVDSGVEPVGTIIPHSAGRPCATTPSPWPTATRWGCWRIRCSESGRSRNSPNYCRFC